MKETFNGLSKFKDGLGKVATIGGWLIFGFFGMAAGNAIAAAAMAGSVATNGAVLGSFWSGLVTDPLTGQMGIGPGLTNMFNGFSGLGQAGLNVATGQGLSAPVFG